MLCVLCNVQHSSSCLPELACRLLKIYFFRSHLLMPAKGCNMQSDHTIPRVPSLASKLINKFTDGATVITIELPYSLSVHSSLCVCPC